MSVGAEIRRQGAYDLFMQPRPVLRPTPSTEPLPAPILTVLEQTRPWITFFAVLGLLVAGLAGWGGVHGVLSSTSWGERVKAGFLLLSAVIYFLPTMFLLRYRSAIERTVNGGGMWALAQALTAQKSFWRTSGLITIWSFVIYAILLVVVLIVAAVAVHFN